MTPSSRSSDDDISSWIQEYHAMDPYLRSEFLDAIGTTWEGWRAMVAAHNRQRAARTRQSSANASQEEVNSTSESDGNEPFEPDSVVVVVLVPRGTESIDFLLDTRGGNGRSRRYSSAPPPRGFAGAGPGRRRSGGGRRHEFRGRPDAPLIRIVITLSEK